MNKFNNTLFISLLMILFSSCSSLQITEESISDQSVAGVMVQPKSTSTQAILANATIYFEYDQYNLTSKSIQALKGVVSVMNKNEKITQEKEERGQASRS